MQRVIVTVKRKDELQVRDLEVPAELEAASLAELIARVLRWDKDHAAPARGYLVDVRPLGRTLQPQESLAAAGVWDGSWLVFYPAGSEAPEPATGAGTALSPPAQEAQGIPAPEQAPAAAVSGWRSLGIDLPAAPVQEQETQQEKPSGGFVWKQLGD